MMKQDLDYVLVSLGVAIMTAYHGWLLRRIVSQPTQTVIGINGINRRIWVQAMMEDQGKNGLLAVQTLRNNIMASTLLASTAIMLSSLIAVLMTRGAVDDEHGQALVYGNTSQLGLSIKFFSIIVCFLLAFLFNVLSIRYYNHASILINVPARGPGQALAAEFVSKTLNRGSYFWSLGLRAFYFSFPLFLWVFGPIPMLSSCLVLVFFLYFLDAYSGWGEGGDGKEEEEKKADWAEGLVAAGEC